MSAAAQVSEKVAAIRRALFEESTNVAEAGDTLRIAADGTEGLLHAGVAAEMYADRGQGKTSVALVASMAHAAAGGRVAYFDRENAPSLNKARLKTIEQANGWPDLLAEEKFVGRHYPSVDRWDGEDVAEAIAGLGFTGVVYDSLREFMGQLRLDPDSEQGVTEFFSRFVTPLLRRGLWVLLLDNVGHLEKGRPKGSATKLDAVAQGYLVETTSRFTPEKIGAIKITCKRSRYGDEERTWTMRLGGGLFETPHPTARPAASSPTGSDLEKCRVAATEILEDTQPLGRDPLIAAMREAGLKFRNDHARDLLAKLASDPNSGITKSPNGYRIEATLALAPDLGATPPGPDTPGQGGATPAGATPETALASANHPGPNARGQGRATPPGPDTSPPEGGRPGQARPPRTATPKTRPRATAAPLDAEPGGGR
jgi:hypothetical protein